MKMSFPRNLMMWILDSEKFRSVPDHPLPRGGISPIDSWKAVCHLFFPFGKVHLLFLHTLYNYSNQNSKGIPFPNATFQIFEDNTLNVFLWSLFIFFLFQHSAIGFLLCSLLHFFKYIYIYIYMYIYIYILAVFGVCFSTWDHLLQCGLSSCGTWTQWLLDMWDLISPTRNWTHVPSMTARILKCWTTRVVPLPWILFPVTSWLFSHVSYTSITL